MQGQKSESYEDPFEEIANAIMAIIKEKGGRVEFSDLEKWADLTNLGKYTLRTVVNELIVSARLKAPEGFYDAETEIEPPIPKVVELPKFSPAEIEKLKEYLREYHSVGLLRLFEDLSRAGLKEINEILKEVIEEGYAELTPSGVVNATKKLIHDQKG
ncbi:MAG: hypothetical protein N3D12_01800 [Candidatus Methanomethyliaceae archaeon]|nr:hypothetical protein [Candidatus Methanomethyliaceae archaeon]